MNYTIDSTNPKIAYIHPGSNIDDIFTILPKVKKFMFEPGDYYLNNILYISKNKISITSTTKIAKDVHIYQNNITKDSIVLDACQNVNISYISIHNTTPGKIVLTERGANDTSVNNCYIYGNATIFSVYYSGPKNLTQGASTLNAYFSGDLDNNNEFYKNVVYSMWSGDNITYALQKNGNFSSNIVRGGRVGIYMCSNVSVKKNIVYDSTSNGIYVSFPSHNIIISNNKIYECESSGIKLANQIEHGDFNSSDNNITISNNSIYDSKYYAVEINDGINIDISDNSFINIKIYGIYCYKCSNINIYNNKLAYFDVSIWLENSSSINIQKNYLYSIYPDEASNILKIINSSSLVTFINNSIGGQIKYELYAIDSTSKNIIISNNTEDPFYTYCEELYIMKHNISDNLID